MNIVIVGAGNVGRALAGGWLKAGHKVTLALREPAGSKASDLKAKGFAVVAPKDAAAGADVIVLAVPWPALAATVKSLGSLDGKIVVDATNPLAPDMSLATGHSDSAGETVARLAPGARVVKAFNTTGANNMADSGYGGGKLMMLAAGDDAQAKAAVMSLAKDLGFEPVDAGPLAMSRHLEPMAMVWIKLAYAQQMGREFGFALLRR
ncbi:MAG: NADPH-dependent F420 reductase [Hyphomicrobiales bacterium]|nr:NADPH-dependent F420 reductase [Hyphomicrobiales bacterium]